MSEQKTKNRYKLALQQIDKDRVYNLVDAIKLLKNLPKAKFDETVCISFKMGIDPRKSALMVRGSCSLPNGSGKKVRVAVFAEGTAAEEAKKAGAEIVGFKDLIAKVSGGFNDFDAAVATPAVMGEVRKLGRVLGPRGLMPNPRTGTVTDDVTTAVEQIKAGKVDFKLDRNANIAVTVGKVSFEENKLNENITAALDAVIKAKPAAAKGNYIMSATLSSTMSPGIRLEPQLYKL